MSFCAFIYHKVINKDMQSILQYFLVPDRQVPFLVRGALVPIVPIAASPMLLVKELITPFVIHISSKIIYFQFLDCWTDWSLVLLPLLCLK